MPGTGDIRDQRRRGMQTGGKLLVFSSFAHLFWNAAVLKTIPFRLLGTRGVAKLIMIAIERVTQGASASEIGVFGERSSKPSSLDS